MAFIKSISNILRPTFSRNPMRTCSTESWKKLNFTDKVAVITGGASGIGYNIAKEFLTHGMLAVTLVDNNKEKLEKSAETLIDEFGDSKVVQYEADVSDIDEMDKAFRNTSMYFQVIDVIVNNAGVLDDTNWEKQLNINMRGCIIGTLLGMQYMAKSSAGEGGIIVNVASIMGILPSNGFPIHTMTQFGIVGFTRALGSSKLYERTGVKVFGYCPGLTDTELFKDDLTDKTINQNFFNEFHNESKHNVKQNPEIVGKNLARILDLAKPGSIWVTENNKTAYEMDYSKAIKKKEYQPEEEESEIDKQTN
ncbi:alcohol dehydrogenase 1-like [Diorhabda carinulata]|uniref:alcohol dehydrogenase 1-like n=1 Tax=Diorhabda carinulata TaxID=1163345 RepID=UPI0025A01DC6|nr:alcohol dehydrogenase 1-like [Diorhabda carinulata]